LKKIPNADAMLSPRYTETGKSGGVWYKKACVTATGKAISIKTDGEINGIAGSNNPTTGNPQAGSRPHPTYPNVLIKPDGQLVPASGYTWASNADGDYSVRLIDGSASGSSRGAASASQSVGSATATSTAGKGLYELSSAAVRKLRKLKNKTIKVGLSGGVSATGILKKIEDSGLIIQLNTGVRSEDEKYKWSEIQWFQ